MTTNHPEKIGRYQVLERVGRGGMGVLYRGIDPVLDREVAIKLMATHFSEDTEEMRPRFYREARAAAKLQHRNIVTVFEFAEEDNTPYIVMEFLRGMSLAARRTQPPALTLDDKLDIIVQLCAGLGYAHEQGVVHRDVKPANMFILADGTLKLLDFGIAKFTTSTLTRAGDVLGSPSYMSPEQISGKEVDGRADIFSAGVVLYELLAGQKPFDADSPTASIVKLLHEEPASLETIDPELPAPLAAAVARALRKDPTERFGTAGELARELQAIRRGLPEPEAVAAGDTHSNTRLSTIYASGALRSPTVAAPPGVTAAQTSQGTLAPVARRRRLLLVGVGAAVIVAAIAAIATLRKETPAPAGPVTIQVSSDPTGAQIGLDGRDTGQTTPAAVAVGRGGSHRLRLSKQGFQPLEMPIVEPDLARGSVRHQLRPVEVAAVPQVEAVSVLITGAYPFEVFDGARSISGASRSHSVNLSAGKTVRLVAPTYLLDSSVRVPEGRGKRVNVRAPELGRLSVRSNLETCLIRIGRRELGYPPINNLSVAAGTYQIDLTCPNGRNPRGVATVTPGQLYVAKVP